MANKPVWVALDTEDIENWIDSCPDWIEDSLSDDEDEVDDKTFEKAKQWVIEHSTDGRLSNELNAALFDTRLGEQFNNMMWDVLMDFIYNEVSAFKAQDNKED